MWITEYEHPFKIVTWKNDNLIFQSKTMVGKLGKLVAFFGSKPNLDTSSAYNSSYSVYQKSACYDDDVKSLQSFQRRSKGWSSLRLTRRQQKGKEFCLQILLTVTFSSGNRHFIEWLQELQKCTFTFTF